jgi:hypothetical protein
MAKYRVVPPFIDDMGSIAPFVVTSYPMESAREAALWEINSMRRHDGLAELEELPKGFRFEYMGGLQDEDIQT